MKVAVVGLGAMGEGIARNVAKAGLGLVVFDRSEEARTRFAAAGIQVAGSLADLGQQADVVLLSLPGPAEIAQVCLSDEGLLQALRPRSLVIDLSTNDQTTIILLGERFAAKQIGFLEAPVSGGPWGARDGTLAIWAGGEPSHFEAARPVLSSIGAHVFHMGELGTGTATKLVHNLGATVRSLLVSEMLVFGLAQGIDPLKLFAAVREGSNGKARTFDLLGFKNLDQTYDAPAFRLRHAHKDMTIAMAAAREKGAELPATALCLSLLDEAMEKGMADLDSTAICRLIEERAGIRFPAVDRAAIDEVLAGLHDGRQRDLL